MSEVISCVVRFFMIQPYHSPSSETPACLSGTDQIFTGHTAEEVRKCFLQRVDHAPDRVDPSEVEGLVLEEVALASQLFDFGPHVQEVLDAHRVISGQELLEEGEEGVAGGHAVARAVEESIELGELFGGQLLFHSLILTHHRGPIHSGEVGDNDVADDPTLEEVGSERIELEAQADTLFVEVGLSARSQLDLEVGLESSEGGSIEGHRLDEPAHRFLHVAEALHELLVEGGRFVGVDDDRELLVHDQPYHSHSRVTPV